MKRYILILLLLSACDDEQHAMNLRDGCRYDKDKDEVVCSVAKPNKELICLTQNIYYESRGVSVTDRVAVAQVTLSRVASNRYPDSICGVVYQPHQFSWTNNRAVLSQKIDRKAWNKAALIARMALNGELKDPSHGATHYYAQAKIKPPRWAAGAYDVVKLQGHTYMKLASN